MMMMMIIIITIIIIIMSKIFALLSMCWKGSVVPLRLVLADLGCGFNEQIVGSPKSWEESCFNTSQKRTWFIQSQHRDATESSEPMRRGTR